MTYLTRVSRSRGFYYAIYTAVTIVAWEAMHRLNIFSEILFPSILAVMEFYISGASGLLFRMSTTLSYILYAMVISFGLSFLLAYLATWSKTAAAVCDLANAVFHPLPALALLPLLLVYFGASPITFIIVVINAALWPLLLNIVTGFKTVSKTYVDVGKNVGLKGMKFALMISLPSAIPHLLSGAETSWTRAWRAAIAVELVYGASAVGGGLGWFIYNARFQLLMEQVLAATFLIAIIGLLVQYGLFVPIKRSTVVKWGMLRAISK